MKRFTTILLFAGLFSLLGSVASGQMSGTYTVDPASTGGFAAREFTSINAATDSLEHQGISAAVTINIADGDYNEQVNLTNVTGTSAANTLTFQSASGDSSAVIVKYSSPSDPNYTWIISNADYVTIKQLSLLALNASYGRLLNVNGSVTNLTVENCQFLGYNTTSNYDSHTLLWSYDDPTDNILIQNNLFLNGAYGIKWDRYSSGQYGNGLQVINNTFKGQREFGIYMKLQNAPLIKNNSNCLATSQK